MTQDYLLLGYGNAIDGEKEITGTSRGLVGAKFTRESIGFAVQKNNAINAILMNGDGITIGAGNIDVTAESDTLRAHDGSYVRISSSEGIELGSLNNLYINTNNFKLQTDSYQV